MSVFLKLSVTALLLWVALIPVAFASVEFANGRYYKTFSQFWLGVLAVALDESG